MRQNALSPPLHYWFTCSAAGACEPRCIQWRSRSNRDLNEKRVAFVRINRLARGLVQLKGVQFALWIDFYLHQTNGFGEKHFHLVGMLSKNNLKYELCSLSFSSETEIDWLTDWLFEWLIFICPFYLKREETKERKTQWMKWSCTVSTSYKEQKGER